MKVEERALFSAATLVTGIRSDLLIQQLLKSATKGPFDIGYETLCDEIESITQNIPSDAIPLEGTDGLDIANDRRASIQGSRDRLLKINQNLRKVKLNVDRAFRTAKVYLRQKEELNTLSQKENEEVVATALEELSDLQAQVKVLMDATRESLSAMDDKTRGLESWFVLHKQYVFMALNRNGFRDDR
jgi:hypothetical protein